MVNLLPLGTSDMTIKHIVIFLEKNRMFGGNNEPHFILTTLRKNCVI